MSLKKYYILEMIYHIYTCSNFICLSLRSKHTVYMISIRTVFLLFEKSMFVLSVSACISDQRADLERTSRNKLIENSSAVTL